MLRRNREIQIFSLSAIDLFCSGMGAVMVLMVILMPYYRKITPIPPPPEPLPPVVATPTPSPPEVPVVPVPVPPEPIPTPPTPAPAGVIIHDLELLIMIDTTGSMGRQIDDFKSSLESIIRVMSRLSERFAIGVIAYRDHGDVYLHRLHPIRQVRPGDSATSAVKAFVGRLGADGGGDFPEAVAEALAVATSQDAGWRDFDSLPVNSKQVILIVADAPGHDTSAERSKRIAEAWLNGDDRRSVSAANPPGAHVSARRYFSVLTEASNGRLVSWSDMLGAILDVAVERE